MGFATNIHQMLWGNGLLVVCCGFYLLWWVLAFKPKGAIKGMRSGWLLIPAFLCGISAVFLILRGASQARLERSFFPGISLPVAAIAAYLILLVVTNRVWKRQITTELLLIVGWTALVFAEVNTLYGVGCLESSSSICFLVVTGICAVVSFICYMLFYGLDAKAGFIDGMIPLILAAMVMLVLTAAIQDGKTYL